MGGKEIALPPFMQTHGGEVFFCFPPIVWGGSGNYGHGTVLGRAIWINGDSIYSWDMFNRFCVLCSLLTLVMFYAALDDKLFV